MTRKQVVFIIGLNAVISVVISVVVALIFVQPRQEVATSTATVPVAGEATLTQQVGEVPSTPAAESVIHTVQAGDTISGLAFQYDVPEEDIIAANQLENPNYLTLGMQLLIPIGGVPPQATATFTPAPTPTDTPLPINPPSVDKTATAAAELGVTTAPGSSTASEDLEIEISEILGLGQLEEERVVITNLGENIAEMEGWTLSGAGGNVFTFPNLRLWKKGSVTVHTRVGEDGTPPSNLYWGKLQPVWSRGDQAVLKDAQGTVLATFSVGP